MEVKRLPRSENNQIRTRNSNTKRINNNNNNEISSNTNCKTTTTIITTSELVTVSVENKLEEAKCFKKVKSGKSMAWPRFGFKNPLVAVATNNDSSSGSICKISTSASPTPTPPPSFVTPSKTFDYLLSQSFRRTLHPLIINTLIFLVFTSAFNFGNCSVNSAATGDSLLNQPHLSVDDTTTTTSSTKVLNGINGKINNNVQKLNDTHNLLLPKTAESQIG